MHTTKRTQEITHACPETFNRIDMHFAHAIAIIITRPFALPMRDSRMLALQARIAAPFIRIHIRAWTCKCLHMRTQGFPIGMFHDPQAHLTTLATHRPDHGWTIIGVRAMPTLVIGAASWRVMRRGVYPIGSGSSQTPPPHNPELN